MSVALLALPRFNAILVGAPKLRINDVIDQIKRFDHDTSPQMHATPFPLRHRSASKTGQTIVNFWSTRWTGETANQHQVRITWDDSANTIYVQAAPADMKEISELIQNMDTSKPKATNDMHSPLPAQHHSHRGGVHLAGRHLVGRHRVGGALHRHPGWRAGARRRGRRRWRPGWRGRRPGRRGGGLGGAGGGLAGAGGLGGAGGGLAGASGLAGAGGAAGAGGLTVSVTGATTKATTIRFVTSQGGRERILESGLLEDIHFITNSRSNSIIVLSPEKTMQLIMAVIDELDAQRSAIVPKVTVYPLKHADAEQMLTLLQKLLFGATTTTAGGRAGGVGATPTTAGGATGTATQAIGTVPLLGLNIGVDDRSNSIILSGPVKVVAGVEEFINRLDLADEQAKSRRSEVYTLHNASAADVANAINTFYSNQLAVYTGAGYTSAFIQLQQQVFIVPEPITNNLLISATPYYFEQLMRFIAALDAQPAQVVIQCLIAEVDLTSTEEFGVEIGLQSPLLFARSQIPPAAGGTTTFSQVAPTATGVLTATGVASSIPASLGFGLSNPATSVNTTAQPGAVGFQGLGNLGVGRSDPNLGIGGFVFSAASDTFSLLIRALKVQGRIDILSRPQLTTLDNQTANLLVGVNIPYSTGTTTTATGFATSAIAYQPTGVLMNVTPRISPDGRVLMRVNPEVSSLSPSTITLGTIVAPEFITQSITTTVACNDGETIVVGGLISKSDEKNENKIPWFGDLPYVGAAFRYRSQAKTKKELLVILTPHVVRSKQDAERIMFEESRRMDWIVGDVLRTQGTSDMEPIIPWPGGMDGRVPTPLVPGAVAPAYPAPPYAPPAGSVLPPPTPLPSGMQQGQAPANAPGLVRPVSQQGGQPAAPTGPAGQVAQQPSAAQGIAPRAGKQEDAQWTVMPNRP